jgi:alpha-ketoglutarate-dependent taurine dioxygenase
VETAEVVVDRDPGADLAARPVKLRDYPIVTGPFSHLVAERERLAALEWRHFDAAQLSPTIGAEIAGLDLTNPLGEDVIAELRRALHDYKVLFFPNQRLNAHQHVVFARRFGELEIHPFIPSNTGEPELVRFEKTAQVAGYENSWHHDVTWRKRPSMGAILHALEVPPRGGDTLFADMYAAYDALDDETKAAIDDLDAVHDFMLAFGMLVPPDQRDEMRNRYPRVRHPVLCTHPATGKRHLYVNRNFVSHIEGIDPQESRALLDRMCRQADYPEHQCRFRWTPHAVAFWDNRAVQHYAASDYWPSARVMERASIVGDQPSRGAPAN